MSPILSGLRAARWPSEADRRPPRRDFDPNMEVDVEILDVNDEKARGLLLSIDPLAELAVN
jgi:hypothetical protein